MFPRQERMTRAVSRSLAGTPCAPGTLVEYLYSRLRGEEPRLIGITGDPETPVARERAEGAEKYVTEAGRGGIYQVVYGDWTYADGGQKAAFLLARYPDTNIIWSANDSMAMGALRAVQARGARVHVGGGGGWPDALTHCRRRARGERRRKFHRRRVGDSVALRQSSRPRFRGG